MAAEMAEGAVKRMRAVVTAAEEKGEFVTTGMLTERMTFPEEAQWMLRARVAE